MVMAKHGRSGNCSLRHLNILSVGSNGTLGIKTVSPAAHPDRIRASTKNLFSLVIRKRVPLHNLGGFKFVNNITGIPNFNVNLCGGKPVGHKEFKNRIIGGLVNIADPIVSLF